MEVLLVFKPKLQYFKGYLMLETLLNFLVALVILETSLDLFIVLELFISYHFTFAMDLYFLDLLLVLVNHSIMQLKQNFKQLLLKN